MLSSKSVKGVGGQPVKQANYQRRQVLEGYVETLKHVRGETYTEAENSQALLSLVVLHPLSAVRRGAQKPTDKESYCRSSCCTSWSWRAQPGRCGETLGDTRSSFSTTLPTAGGSAKWVYKYKPLGFTYCVLQWLTERTRPSLKHGHSRELRFSNAIGFNTISNVF